MRTQQDEELQKRQAMVETVHATVAGISERLDAQAATVAAQADENGALKEQLTRLLATLQAQEAHTTQQAKAHDLERQIWEAKAKQQVRLFWRLGGRCWRLFTRADSVRDRAGARAGGCNGQAGGTRRCVRAAP